MEGMCLNLHNFGELVIAARLFWSWSVICLSRGMVVGTSPRPTLP